MMNAAEELNNSIRRRFALAVLLVLSVMSVLMVVGAGVLEFKGLDLGIAFPDYDPTAITIDWKREYPFFDNNYEETEAQKRRKAASTLSKAYKQYIKFTKLLNTFGETNKNHIYYYSEIAKVGFLCELSLTSPSIGGPGVGGSSVLLSNGMWTWAKYKMSDESVASATDGIVSLNNFLKKNGIPFLFIHAVDKNCRADPKFPPSVVDYLNDNEDRIFETLKEQGVNTLDLRKELHKDFDDHYAFFYKTDHHWDTRIGLWAADVAERRVEELYGLKFYRGKNGENNYHLETYKNALFGSQGHTVTRLLAKPEDFSILYPNFKTYFNIVIPDREINATGSFGDVFINKEKLEIQNANFGGDGYVEGCLLFGNRPMVKIKNYMVEDCPRVVLVKDSSSLAMAPYMAMGCSELDSIDVRPESGNFDGSLRTYILKMKPDVVIMINFPHELDYK